MLNLTHVLRSLVLVVLFLVPFNTQASVGVKVNELYCDGLSLMAKATSEAHQRKEPEAKWRKNLETLKGHGVKDKDNVLYYILPQAVTQVKRIYQSKQNPKDTYIAEYNRCMSEQYGQVVVVN